MGSEVLQIIAYQYFIGLFFDFGVEGEFFWRSYFSKNLIPRHRTLASQ
jgi:hypothetical protein